MPAGKVHYASPAKGGVTCCGKPVGRGPLAARSWRSVTCWRCILKIVRKRHPNWVCVCKAPRAAFLALEHYTVQRGFVVCLSCFSTVGRAPKPTEAERLARRRELAQEPRILCNRGCGHYHRRRCATCGCRWLRYERDASGNLPVDARQDSQIR